MKLKQVLVTYTAATMANAVAGLVAADWLRHWGYDVDSKTLVETTWLASVGIPSLWVAGEETLRALGKRPRPPWAQRPARQVPVYTRRGESSILLQAVKSVLGRDDNSPDAEIVLSYVYPSVDNRGYAQTFVEDEISRALRLAWRRRHRQPWSRSVFLAQLEMKREEYDALMNLLRSVPGIVVDRRARRSGKIKLPPARALDLLRRRRGLPLLEG
ncbi:MAG: hypothetical protein ACE5FD_05300 [Anaerolineae bacterium]